MKIRVEWQFLRYADPDENSNKFWEYHVISVDDGRGFMRTGGTVYRWGRTGAVGQTKHEWAAPYARADQKRRKGYTTVYSETFEYNSMDEFMASGHMVEKVKGTWIAAFGLPDTPSEVPGESLAKEAFALTQQHLAAPMDGVDAKIKTLDLRKQLDVLREQVLAAEAAIEMAENVTQS